MFSGDDGPIFVLEADAGASAGAGPLPADVCARFILSMSSAFGKLTCGPMKCTWSDTEGKSRLSCSQTCGGSEDSPRAPMTKMRKTGLPTPASSVSGVPGETCSVERRASRLLGYSQSFHGKI